MAAADSPDSNCPFGDDLHDLAGQRLFPLHVGCCCRGAAGAGPLRGTGQREKELRTPGSREYLETFADDSSNVLHQVALDDIKDGRLMLEGDLSYLIYTSKQSAEQVVTKEAEQKIRDDATAREEEKTQKQDSATKSSSLKGDRDSGRVLPA